MGLPASAFQLTTVVLVAVFTTYVRKSRHIALVLTYLMAIAGILMIKLLPTAEKLSRLAGFWLIMAVAPAFPLMLSLSASNIAGFTKKSTVMAMIFLGYCAGNLSGPQFFISTEAPGYHVSNTTSPYMSVANFYRLLTPLSWSAMPSPLLLWWAFTSTSPGRTAVAIMSRVSREILRSLDKLTLLRMEHFFKSTRLISRTKISDTSCKTGMNVV